LSHCTSPFLWWIFLSVGLTNYLSELASTMILLNSASWVARIVAASHWCWSDFYLFQKDFL
jgi:hypothetical protein